MKTFVGIDLGSTTTKAVLLDEDRKVVGHGITNSRSNYATAARVGESGSERRRAVHAISSSVTDAHAQIDLDTFLGALERAFRLEQFLEQLDDLEQTCISQIQGERFAKVGSGVKASLGEVFQRLRKEAPSSIRLAPSVNRTSSAISRVRATTRMPKRSRARRTFPMTCFSTCTTSRSSKLKTGRRQAS